MKDEINDYDDDGRWEYEVAKAEYDFDELESALKELESDEDYPKWLDERQKEDLAYQMEHESRQYAEDAAADHLAEKQDERI